jgi:hypothetical protein
MELAFVDLYISIGVNIEHSFEIFHQTKYPLQ